METKFGSEMQKPIQKSYTSYLAKIMAQRLSGMESLWPGRVTQVIDPHYFWMQLGTRESLSQFEKIQRNLQEFGRHNFRSLGEADMLEYGQVVLVDTGDSSAFRFKRGQVARITSGNSVDIFYVDYGNTELTTLDKIMANMPVNFKSWMPQAVRCSLAGVRPISKNWTTRGTKTFQNATNGILLHTLVLHGEPGYCEVSLYPSDTDDARAIAYLLLEEEVAMQKDGDGVPEFVRDVPEFMTSYMTRAYSEKMRSTDDHHILQKQEPVTVDTSSSLQLPPNSASPSSSPPSNGKSSDKYIPPGRKYQEKSLKSPGSQFTGSPPSHSTIPPNAGQMISPSIKTTPPQMTKNKEPVIDFFPFDNVSTYPPTPVSPVKSPGRTSSASGPQDSSYFSRSPSRYDQTDQQSSRGFNNGQQYKGRGADLYYNNSSDRNTYRNGGERSHRKSYEHHHDRSRFAANFDNLPSAAANLEPPYLNQMSERNGKHASGDVSSSSMSPGKSKHAHPEGYSPSRPVRNINDSVAPFYPPSQIVHMPNNGDLQSVNLTTPQFYQSKNTQSESYGKSLEELTPPGYYQTNKSGIPSKHSDPYYPASGDGYSYPGSYAYKSDTLNNQSFEYGSGENYSSPDYRYNYGNMENGPSQQRYDHRYYQQDNRSAGHYNSPSNNDYHHTKGSPGGGFQPTSNSNSSAREHPPRPHVKIPSNQTPTKSGHQKMSPASPDSPGIAAFDLSDIEQTEFASADLFHQRMYQEKLQTLKEEAADIEQESKEQSELAQMARYGIVAIGDGDGHSFYHPVDHEVFQKISEDISVATRETEELKKSPIKHSNELLLQDGPPKMDGMPGSYIADIDYTEAVKEVLDFAKTGGIENAKALLDNVVESLQTARCDKQLFEVLMMLLTKAIQEYDLCHDVVMETIDRLNNEMEIREALAKALKRQQELCVTVPVKKNSKHQHFSQVMGAVYNRALDWSERNATIQDSILVTVEKWILFNNKGSQIGQTDKENVFLDCFVSFWEMSGSELLKRKDGFRSRLLDEIKQKLLHEGVSRSIRERLLEILLEFFFGSNKITAVMENSCTQTPRKTMIPSSCQVKPTLCDKSSMTEADWLDEFSGYEPEDSRWFTATDFSSPDPSVNLRPQGQRSMVSHLTSTPENMLHTGKNKPHSGAGTPQKGTHAIDQSCSSTSESEYSTPNSSFVSDKSRLGKTENKTNSATNPSPSNSISEQANSAKGGSPQNAREMQKSQTNKRNTSDNKGVCETKSAQGKSIVDWFDYQPDTEATGKSAKTAKQVVKTKNLALETKLSNVVSSQNKADKNLDELSNEFSHLSLSNIEEKYSVIEQGKDSVEQVNTSAKSRKKDKKAAKNVQVTNRSDKRVQNINRPVDKDKDVQMNVGKGESICEESQSVGDGVTDWWGADEEADSKSTQSKHGACHIHIDASPDVIIEDEFMEDIKNIETVEQPEADIDTDNNTPASDTRDCSSSPKSQSSFIQMEEANRIHGAGDIQDESRLCVEEGVGLTARVNDIYGFEGDLSEDNWESDNSDDLNVILSPVNNKEEGVNITNDKVQVSVAAACNKAEESYDRNFPRTCLADYIRPLQEPVHCAPVSRWVPKKRICLNCHDDGHTTENCPKGINLLQ